MNPTAQTTHPKSHHSLLSRHTTWINAGIMGAVLGVVLGLNDVLLSGGQLNLNATLLSSLALLAMVGAGIGMMAATILVSLLHMAISDQDWQSASV